MHPRPTLPTPAPSRLTAALALAVLWSAPAAVLHGQDGPVASPGPAPTLARPFTVAVHGAGEPMILIPGMTSAGAVWDATAAHFSRRYEVHVLTLAGFAGVPPVESEHFLRLQRDALLEYLHDEGLEQPVIVGHSLGGFLAYWIAATDPEAVGPVVAVDGVPFLPALNMPDADESSLAAQAEQMADFYATLSGEQMRSQTRMAAQAMVRDSADVERIATWGARSDGATAGTAFAEMMTTDLRDEVARIRAPLLLVMAGGGMEPEARARTRRAYEAQVAAVPDARVVVAEEARHFVMLDDPDFLHGAVEVFLEDRR